MGRNVFHEQMEVESYHGQSQRNYLEVVSVIRILSFLGGRDRGGWCKRQCRIPSSSSWQGVNEYPCFGSKRKCRNNNKMSLDGLFAAHTIASQPVFGKSHTAIYIFQTGVLHSCIFSLTLLHRLVKCLLALSFSISLGSRIQSHISIQLITAIVMHPLKTLLRRLPALWLPLFVKFVSYMNHVFALDTDPARSLRGKRTRARTNEWDTTAEHPFSCLFDELKCSVDESGCLDDAKQLVSQLNSSQDDVAGSRKHLQAHIYIRLAYPPYWQSLEPSTHRRHLCYHMASPLMIY